MEQIIIDATAAFREFDRRIDETAPAFARADLHSMIEHVWYCLLHPDLTGSALMDYGCRLKDQHHPFAGAVFSFGMLLQDALREFQMYHPEFPLRNYHFTRRHGFTAILVTYAPHKEI